MNRYNGIFFSHLLRVMTITFTVILLSSCSSSIVSSESLRTSSAFTQLSNSNKPVDIIFADTQPKFASTEVGRVSARAWLLEKGIEAIKNEARKLGAEAVINVKYERRFSADYLQDLYFIDGTAVVWLISSSKK
jgi:hypothetical protein